MSVMDERLTLAEDKLSTVLAQQQQQQQYNNNNSKDMFNLSSHSIN